MKILVTGATGFVGAAVARRLVQHGHTVLGLARSESAATRVKSAGLTPIHGDFAEPATLAGAVSQVDVIISTASIGQVEGTPESEREKTDVSRHAGRAKTDEPRRDSDLASEHQADLNRDAERVEADKAKLQSRSDLDASRDLGRADMGRSRAQRQAARDERLRVEREITDEAIKAERRRADAATERERRDYQASAKSSAELLSQEHADHLKTKSALTTREEFLAIVSHDLRNPLNHISMAAQNLLEEPKDVKELASAINRSAVEMLRLIQDLLDIERISVGRLTLHYEEHDVSEIIKEAVEEFKGDAAAKEIILGAKPQDVCGYVVCDRSRVMQVLSNLIGNAIKFTPAKGQICVSCARIGTEGKEVQVSVSDTGAGIAPEKIKTIFERFSQIHSQDRRGIGLGLYIAKMMVEEHPGRIWVESKLGEGSTFHFTLPLRSADPDANNRRRA
jgi:signal transduction histidine kinase